MDCQMVCPWYREIFTNGQSIRRSMSNSKCDNGVTENSKNEKYYL